MPTRPAQNDDEDGDPSVSASLLAGPRNVKPYIARRGEQYMNKEQLEQLRTHIAELEARSDGRGRPQPCCT